MRRFLTPLLAILLALAVVLVPLALGGPTARADTVTTTISLGSGAQPFGPIGVNPTTKLAYVANTGKDTVSVIDVDSTHGTYNTVIATIPVGSGPDGVGVDPTTNNIFVANQNSNNVLVIDGDTNTVTATIPVGTQPQAPAVNPTTRMVYVPDFGSSSVSVIDESTNTVVATVPVGSGPASAVVDPATNRIYVTDTSVHLVSVIDDNTNTVVNTISVGNDPWPIAIDPTAKLLYVGNSADSTLSVIDLDLTHTTTYETVIHTITLIASPGIANPQGIGVNPTTHKVYVADNTIANHVQVIDGDPASPQYDQVIATLTAGKVPVSVGVLPGDPGTIYVANQTDSTVSVIEGSDLGDIATPTNTATATDTATPTLTDTATPTATNTATLTPTPTDTGTPTATNTATPVVYHVYLPDVAPLPANVTPPPYPLHRR